jgi:hypothetical protein
VTATRSATPSTIFANTGYIYTVNIPAGDDIQHLSIFDVSGGPGAAQFRVIFNWLDSDFVGNDTTNPVQAVAPNFTVSVYVDVSGSPSLASSAGVHRSSGTSSNEFRTYGFSSKSVTVDVQLQDGSTTWFNANFTF